MILSALPEIQPSACSVSNLLRISSDATGVKLQSLSGDSIPSSPPNFSTSKLQKSFELPGRIFLDVFSGFDRPLSHAMLAAKCAVLSIDVAIDTSYDILCDEFFEQLLRLCASGKAGYTAVSPCCEDVARISRGVKCLSATYVSGGRGHLVQPAAAISWNEDSVQTWLTTANCSCIMVAACAYNLEVHESWVFASSLVPLQQLASTCAHRPLCIARATADSLSFLRQFPESLAVHIAGMLAPTLACNSRDLSLFEALHTIPTKQLVDPPHALQDGGGIFSFPDWSYPRTSQSDLFGDLRRELFQYILQNSLHKRVLCHFHLHDPHPPFSDAEVAAARNLVHDWMVSHHLSFDWSIREYQPMRLSALQAISHIMEDADSSLFPSLLEGVPTGYFNDRFFHQLPLQARQTSSTSAFICQIGNLPTNVLKSQMTWCKKKLRKAG